MRESNYSTYIEDALLPFALNINFVSSNRSVMYFLSTYLILWNTSNCETISNILNDLKYSWKVSLLAIYLNVTMCYAIYYSSMSAAFMQCQIISFLKFIRDLSYEQLKQSSLSVTK